MNQISSRAYFKAFCLALFLGVLGSIIHFGFSIQKGYKVYLVLEMTATEKGVSQVFFNTGNGYSESESVRSDFFNLERKQILKFEVPEQPVQSIRFDTSNGSAPVEIHALAFRAVNGALIQKVPLEAIQPVSPTTAAKSTAKGVEIFIPEGVDVLDPQTSLALDYPLSNTYGNSVFVLPSIFFGIAICVLFFFFWALIRFIYPGTMIQFIGAIPSIAKKNFYLINKPDSN